MSFVFRLFRSFRKNGEQIYEGFIVKKRKKNREKKEEKYYLIFSFILFANKKHGIKRTLSLEISSLEWLGKHKYVKIVNNNKS